MAPVASHQLGAILLAAGKSSRLGQPKQLLEVGGEPLVVRQAKLLLELGAASVVVVAGSDHEKISGLLSTLPVRCVQNPDSVRGMGTSLACGVRAMPERARAALVLLCDQWRLTPGDLQSLVDAWSQDPLSAVLASFDGTRGPPAILPRAMFERLTRLTGDSGAKNILKRWKGPVRTLPMERAAADVDIAEDLPGHPGSG